MMFLFAVPVMQAVASYLIPLMIGARSVAFVAALERRLLAFSNVTAARSVPWTRKN
ncbi:hypothetical protein KNO81_40190 [Paraburkholderia sediminicola]|nr:hypothetical protein [Paraburkholderia sediminicola]MDR3389588.1 hypothetical protein [Rudaea sp.]